MLKEIFTNPVGKNICTWNNFFRCLENLSEVVITWSRLARMKLCPVFLGSRQCCYKLFRNYILRLHVKSYRHTRRVGSETRDHTSGIRDPLWSSGTRDSKIFKWDPWSGTLMNNLLAWKFECCNKSVHVLLENQKMKTNKNSLEKNNIFKRRVSIILWSFSS